MNISGTMPWTHHREEEKVGREGRREGGLDVICQQHCPSRDGNQKRFRFSCIPSFVFSLHKCPSTEALFASLRLLLLHPSLPLLLLLLFHLPLPPRCSSFPPFLLLFLLSPCSFLLPLPPLDLQLLLLPSHAQGKARRRRRRRRTIPATATAAAAGAFPPFLWKGGREKGGGGSVRTRRKGGFVHK
jgi:hypothetical protein